MTGTVLVTGGFGFIGAHVVQEELASGADVLVIDRQQESNSADDVLNGEQRAAVCPVGSSVPGIRALTSLLREFAVEVVVHLASPLATVTEERPRLSVDDMIAPQRAVLEACRLAKVRRLVWASSVGVFGRVHQYSRLPIGNDAAHFPLTSYGAAKSFLERLSAQYTSRYGLDTVGLRFPLVYGPGRRRGGGQFTSELIEGAAFGKPCVLNASDERYSWLHVADAARCVRLAVEAASPTSARALTVCGDPASSREVAEMLLEWFPDAQLTMLPGTTDLVADYDPAPAFEELGFRPVRSLRDGVLATANAARQRAGLPLVV